MKTNNNPFPELGQALDALRQSLGITQREIAAECHISLTTYQQVLLGKI